MLWFEKSQLEFGGRRPGGGRPHRPGAAGAALGVSKTDTQRDADYLSEKIAHLRVFEDADGKLNRSLIEMSGELLVVSQFTLLADCRKGRRPSFTEAAEPELATRLYEHFVRQTAKLGISVQTGCFQARMAVSLVNDGPVTLIIDSL